MKMAEMINAPFITEMADTCANMYRLGWDERNGGNISLLLDENEVSEYVDIKNILRKIPIDLKRKIFAGSIFLLPEPGSILKM